MPIRNKNLDVFRDEIQKLFAEKISIFEIAKKFNVHYTTINHRLKAWGVFKPYVSATAFSNDQIEFFRRSYGKVTNIELAKELKVNLVTINKYQQQLGLKKKGSGNRVVQTYNPFLDESDESEYWLGFIAGDGNLAKTTYKITISTTDEELITKFKKFYKKPVTVCEHFYKVLSGETHRIFTASVQNQLIYEYLIALGITPKKSLTIKLNKELSSAFVRGLFDADGWIGLERNEAKITSASPALIEQLKTFFFKHQIPTSPTTKGRAVDLCIYGKQNIIKLFNLFYSNASICLERKKERFDLLIK